MRKRGGGGGGKEREGRRLDAVGVVVGEVPLGDGLVVSRLVAELEALRLVHALLAVASGRASVRSPGGRAPRRNAAARMKRLS